MSDELCPFPLSGWNDVQLAELYDVLLHAGALERALGLEVKAEIERRGAIARAR